MDSAGKPPDACLGSCEWMCVLADEYGRPPETVELDPRWTSEIRNRIAQIESGKAKTIPWDEVDARTSVMTSCEWVDMRHAAWTK